MSYTLGLLFEYHRYRKDAILRVYADDRLVDELSLSSDIKMKIINVTSMYDSFIGPRNQTPVILTPEKLFLFEIDEKYLCNRIRIEIQNNHNNYTNGFMTKFSYVSFYDMFLVPSCLLKNKKYERLLERFPVPANDQWPHFPLAHEMVLKSDTRINQASLRGHIIGGNFSIEIPLSRKHGIIHLGKILPGTLCLRPPFARVLWSFNL